MSPQDLVEAAWEALRTGRPRALQVLEQMLGQSVSASAAQVDQERLRSLARLLVATERNLRILRGRVGR